MTSLIKNHAVSIGEDSLSELSDELDRRGHKSILLVTGRGSYLSSGVNQLLAPILLERVVECVYDFDTNPKREDLEKLLIQVEDFPFTAIIAVGGGSVIDMAKLVKSFTGSSDKISETLHEGVAPTPLDVDLWAIPTTAGSGSEATHFAVLYDQDEKFSVVHPDLLPKHSWLLPTVLVQVPSQVAAAAAMDAFCQGVESYWSIYSSEESQRFAREAIELSWKYMVSAVIERDLNSVTKMAEASHLAGKAINLTRTTAPHALAYPLTTHYGLLHGHSVSLFLPSILTYNYGVNKHDLLDQRGIAYVKSVIEEIASLIGEDTLIRASEVIREKMKQLGLAVTLEESGVTDVEVIVQHGFNPDRVNNNPRKLSEPALREIIQGII